MGDLDVRVIFVEPLYELNIGYIARVMKNFGFKELYLVNPQVKLGMQARMMATHAQDILNSAVIVKELDDAIKDVDFLIGTTGKPGKDHNVERAAITLSEFISLIEESKVFGKLGILLGREDHGLPNEILERCDIVVTIEANPEYPILNVSHAAAIILYEIYKCKVRIPHFIHEAKGEEKERLIKFFELLLDKIDYPMVKRKRVLIAFRRLLGRALVSSKEIHALYGVFRRTLSLLDKCSEKNLFQG
ncbi:MAG: RNA methyltransferase [Thermoprotei archaeon]|nr:MAG: RNA methyltransferase [Thermoprotei archaeon]RLF20384.1 MAG: RNA methyltransferase [Thermoprotei archaeon]